MKNNNLKSGLKRPIVTIATILFSSGIIAQTNVFDDVIATSPNHTSLKTALEQEGLDVALQDNSGTFTVFAPDNSAFDELAVDLGTDINGLLALPNLSDILLYHVLGVTAEAASISNGDIVSPLNNMNTIKLTKTSEGSVYVNHAMVNAADLSADNGVVHSVGEVLLAGETVVDVALDNGFTTLATALITAELIPALSDPFAEFTVFAPDNAAFDSLVATLGTDINGLLAMPNLSSILLYHVVAGTVLSTDLVNGMVPTLNGQDVEINLDMGVMVNLSNVTLADVTAGNGVVHVIDAVLLPSTAEIKQMNIEQLSIAPNPVLNKLNIQNGKNGDYTIMSIYGSVIETGVTKNGKIDLSELASGNYVIQLVNDEGLFQTKFVKL